MTKSLLVILLVAICFGTAKAQLCKGSSGDPSATIDFGTNANPASPLPFGTSVYDYTFNGCPEPGKYTYGSRVFACYNTTWQTLITDHTPGDFDGLYMLVNAQTKTGTFFLDTITGLCPLSNYEISAYLCNVLRDNACTLSTPIDPVIEFNIQTLSGNTLLNYSSGSIPVTDKQIWRQYGSTFQTPPNVSTVILKISNAAKSVSDCGNVFAIDDIVFKPCGPLVTASISDNSTTMLNLCEGDNGSYVLRANYATGFVDPAFQWQVSNDGLAWTDIPGATSVTYTRKPTSIGYYYYRMAIAEKTNISSLQCRIYSNKVVVNFENKPFVQVTSYVYGCYGSPVVLFAAGGSKFQWTGPNNFISNNQGPIIPEVKFTDAGKYNVKVYTQSGCSDTASVDLVVYPAAHATHGSDVSVCEGGRVQISAGGGTVYDWYPDEPGVLSRDSIANPYASPADTTKYTVKVTNEYGCSDIAYITVNVWKKPRVNAGLDLRTRLGIPITFNGDAFGSDIHYFWTPVDNMQDANTLHPVANPQISTTYTLHVVSNRGCGEVSDDMYVKVYDKIYIPNSFSPNGDGINDKWIIEPLDLFTNTELKVFNRYGQVVYTSKGAFQPWDGTRNGIPLPVGTYYYVLDLKIKNEKPMTGSITILR